MDRCGDVKKEVLTVLDVGDRILFHKTVGVIKTFQMRTTLDSVVNRSMFTV